MSVSTLLPRDTEMFARLKIPAELPDRYGIVRVSHIEARQYGFNGTGDNAGIIFVYFSRHDGHHITYRLRRDNPEVENGKPKAKYLSPIGDKRHLYFVPGVNYDDPDATIVLVESEKTALALVAFVERIGVRIAPVAMGGCWGWRGKIGKAETSNGQRVDEKGPLHDLEVCRNRNVMVMLDSNVATNPDVRRAERKLVATLVAMDAKVRIARIPEAEGINGPDDLIGAMGDDAMRRVLGFAKPATECAVSDAEAIIRSLEKDKHNADLLEEALDAVAAITDSLKCKVIEAELASAVFRVIPRKTISEEIHTRLAKRREECEEWQCRISEAELLNRPVNVKQLIADLEQFFADRAYLPVGAALLLAFWSLLSWVYEICDSVPYLCLESAVPGCGKSTILRLLNAVCRNAQAATSLTEAVLFRLVDQFRSTLLVDEAETIEGESDRAKALRAIFHEGYKRGGRVPRCDGENNEIRWFDVYSPKALAVIGGVTGPLLERCLVIHMQKAPRGAIKKSTRTRALERAAKPLLSELEAYRVQASDQLGKIYDSEPDQGYWPEIADRESELWGPLLINARLIGPDIEAKLLTVVDIFAGEKFDIQAADWKVAKVIALLEALEELGGQTFRPGDLVDALAETEAWSLAFGKVKGSDDKARRKGMAAKIGYLLKDFRLKSCGKGRAGVEYELRDALNIIRAHVPKNHAHHAQAEPSTSQGTENDGVVNGVNGVNGFGGNSWKSNGDPDTAAAGQGNHPASDAENGEDFFSGEF